MRSTKEVAYYRAESERCIKSMNDAFAERRDALSSMDAANDARRNVVEQSLVSDQRASATYLQIIQIETLHKRVVDENALLTIQIEAQAKHLVELKEKVHACTSWPSEQEVQALMTRCSN